MVCVIGLSDIGKAASPVVSSFGFDVPII